MPKIPNLLTSAPRAFSQFATTLNGLISWAGKVEKIEARDGLKFDASAENMVISFPGLASAIAAASLHAFYATPKTGAAVVTFEPGQVTSGGLSISPTVGGGSAMATVPRPELTITTSGVIYLEATVDGAGNATAIDTKNAATKPADTATLKRLTITNVTKAGALVTVTARPIRASLTLYLCNGTAIWE
jgi:hypothetical protein